MKHALPLAVTAGAFALSLALLALTGSVVATVAPVLLVALGWALFRAPLPACSAALFFLALIADAPQDNPMDGKWNPPLLSLGRLLCDNLNKSVGVPLPASGLDLLTAALLVRALASALERRTARPLRWSLAAFGGALALLALCGAARGGNMDAAYWQVRQLMLLPLLVPVLAQAGARRLGAAVLVAALVRCAEGFWFYFVVEPRLGISAPLITTHGDSMLFCLALLIPVVAWLEQPGRAVFRRCALFVPLMLTALALNNRRITWVGLVASAATIASMIPAARVGRARRRLALLLVPLAAVYFAVGWDSTLPAFQPVASVRTIVAPDRLAHGADESTRAREIEDWNLAQTLRRHPAGLGLGHGYDEDVKGPDISEDFPLYRYIPHNSVLGLLTMGGPVGFFFLWALFATGVFLAVRAYHAAPDAPVRTAAVCAVCAILLFLVQAFGDMGTQSFSTVFLAAAALAVAGRLALETGALAVPQESYA